MYTVRRPPAAASAVLIVLTQHWFRSTSGRPLVYWTCTSYPRDSRSLMVALASSEPGVGSAGSAAPIGATAIAAAAPAETSNGAMYRDVSDMAVLLVRQGYGGLLRVSPQIDARDRTTRKGDNGYQQIARKRATRFGRR